MMRAANQEVVGKEAVHLDHGLADGVGSEEHNRDEVLVVLDLGPLPELQRVLDRHRVDVEHVTQQGQALLAGVVQVQPQDLVVVQRLIGVIRLDVLNGRSIDPDQVPTHAIHGVRPAR
jgi:hypothetical protein